MGIQRRGFTLIELLVVIAIIAILAAILFPVFAKAREKARQTQCVNNQKQIATATLIYAQEHEEKFPTADTFWSSVDVPAKVLICPTAGKTVSNAYVYSDVIAGKSLGEIATPTMQFVTADGAHQATASPQTYANVAYDQPDLAKRHAGICVASYADGHVEASNHFPPMLRLWLNAENITDINSSNGVNVWPDMTGLGFNATTVSTSKPVLESNVIGSFPAVKFNGTSDRMTLYDKYLFSYDSGVTLFAVVKPTAATNRACIMDFGRWTEYCYTFCYDTATYQVGASSMSGGGWFTSGNTHTNGTNPVIFTGVIRFQDRFLARVNGKELKYASCKNLKQLTANEVYANPTPTAKGVWDYGPVTIGAQSKSIGGTDRFYPGYIAEIRWYSAGLTDDQCRSIETELSQKYGINLQ